MKTPREILVDRHISACQQLDRVRAEVVSMVGLRRCDGTERTGAPITMCVRRFWRQWLWPSPWAWAGGLAVWMITVALNVASSESPSGAVQAAAPSRVAWQFLVRSEWLTARPEPSSLVEGASGADVPPPRSQSMTTQRPA